MDKDKVVQEKRSAYSYPGVIVLDRLRARYVNGEVDEETYEWSPWSMIYQGFCRGALIDQEVCIQILDVNAKSDYLLFSGLLPESTR